MKLFWSCARRLRMDSRAAPESFLHWGPYVYCLGPRKEMTQESIRLLVFVQAEA